MGITASFPVEKSLEAAAARNDFPPAGLLVRPGFVRLPFSVLWG